MSGKASRSAITSRIIRAGDSLPDMHVDNMTPEERIDAVWEMTLQCLAWQGVWGHEPRLQRSVVRTQRARRWVGRAQDLADLEWLESSGRK